VSWFKELSHDSPLSLWEKVGKEGREKEIPLKRM